MDFLDKEIDEHVSASSGAAGPLRVGKLRFFGNDDKAQNHLADGMKGHPKVIEKRENMDGIGANAPQIDLNREHHGSDEKIEVEINFENKNGMVEGAD